MQFCFSVVGASILPHFAQTVRVHNCAWYLTPVARDRLAAACTLRTMAGRRRARTKPSPQCGRVRVATLNTRFVLDRYNQGRLPLVRDTIRRMLVGDVSPPMSKSVANRDDSIRIGESKRDTPPAAPRVSTVLLGLQESCVSPIRGTTCLPDGVSKSCHGVDVVEVRHVPEYVTQFALLRWLASLWPVRVIVWLYLACASLFNERFLERCIGSWGQAAFYHSLGKYIYMVLGTAFVFGGTVVVSSPADLVAGKPASPTGVGHSVVDHRTLVVGDFRAVHAATVDIVPKDGSDQPARQARVIICNVHLASDVRSAKLRRQQAVLVTEWLAGIEAAMRADAVFIVGDFNAGPTEPTHEVLTGKGFRNAFAATHGGETGPPTFPSGEFGWNTQCTQRGDE